MRIELLPFTEDHLPIVEPWFDDHETQRWLGDRAWPRRLLTLVTPPDRVAFLAYADGLPVALVDVEHMERTSFALVVSPDVRRQGIGRRVLAEVMRAELAGRQLHAGVERGNEASARLLEGADLRLSHTEDDGFDIYVHP